MLVSSTPWSRQYESNWLLAQASSPVQPDEEKIKNQTYSDWLGELVAGQTKVAAKMFCDLLDQAGSKFLPEAVASLAKYLTEGKLTVGQISLWLDCLSGDTPVKVLAGLTQKTREKVYQDYSGPVGSYWSRSLWGNYMALKGLYSQAVFSWYSGITMDQALVISTLAELADLEEKYASTMLICGWQDYDISWAGTALLNKSLAVYKYATEAGLDTRDLKARLDGIIYHLYQQFCLLDNWPNRPGHVWALYPDYYNTDKNGISLVTGKDLLRDKKLDSQRLVIINPIGQETELISPNLNCLDLTVGMYVHFCRISNRDLMGNQVGQIYLPDGLKVFPVRIGNNQEAIDDLDDYSSFICTYNWKDEIGDGQIFQIVTDPTDVKVGDMAGHFGLKPGLDHRYFGDFSTVCQVLEGGNFKTMGGCYPTGPMRIKDEIKSADPNWKNGKVAVRIRPRFYLTDYLCPNSSPEGFLNYGSEDLVVKEIKTVDLQDQPDGYQICQFDLISKKTGEIMPGRNFVQAIDPGKIKIDLLTAQEYNLSSLSLTKGFNLLDDGAFAGINGGFFAYNYQPEWGTISEAKIITPVAEKRVAIGIWQNGEVKIDLIGPEDFTLDSLISPTWSGVWDLRQNKQVLLWDGLNTWDETCRNDNTVRGCDQFAARTALGLTAGGKIIIITTENALSFAQTAAVLKRFGCVRALNLDGGPSVSLFVKTKENGEAEVSINADYGVSDIFIIQEK